MADAKSGSREGGGGEAPQTRSGDPGATESAPLPTPRSLGPRPSGRPTATRLRGGSATRPPRRGVLPSPTPAQGNGAGRLRAGKAFGQSGLRQRPIPRIPKANRHSNARFPSACPPVRQRRRWPASAAAPSASPCPFQELIDFKPVTSIADSVASARFPAAERDEKDLRGRTGLVLTLGVGEGERAAAARETAPLGTPAHQIRRRCYCRWSRDRRFSRTFPPLTRLR